MRGFHGAVSKRDFGVVDALDTHQLYAPNRSNDVENRIDRSDFVEMQLVGRDTVDCRLDSRNHLERRVCGARHLIGDF